MRSACASLRHAGRIFYRRQRRERRSNFQPPKNLLATFVSFCWTESGGALSMAQAPWRRRVPPSMTKRSTAVQLFCHSFVISCFVICSSLVCIGVHSWLKTKISVDTYQRIPVKGSPLPDLRGNRNKENSVETGWAFQQSHHLVQAPPYEKEIFFSVSIF